MSYILAAIVTYHPDIDHLRALVASISPQVHRVIIIDNNSNASLPIELGVTPEPQWQINSQNLGLATAYNFAINIAKEESATHLLLLDQDSLPAADMVSKLLQAMGKMAYEKLTIAAAGPNYADIKGNYLSPFVKMQGLRLVRVNCEIDEIAELDHLISSGSLIDMRAFEEIGGFSDFLFIDYVDTEWCLRARHAHLQLLGVGNAYMSHNIGDTSINIFGRQVLIHSPLRLYYQFRNQIWLIRRPWVSWQWRIIDGIRLFKLFIVFGLFVPGRIKNISFILRGIFHGLTSRMGKLS